MPLKPLRIAFLTPEFVNEDYVPGGISSYVYRITKALKLLGHDPEVFVRSRAVPAQYELEGIHVERVRPYENIPLRILRRSRLEKYFKMPQTLSSLRHNLGMARAVAKREKEKPFDFIHSSDCAFPAFFVKKMRQRPLVVRCSWARELWIKADRSRKAFDMEIAGRMGKMLIRRADFAYAPSEFVAKYYTEKEGISMKTLRPPFLLDAEPSPLLPFMLPKRFLLHFGALGPIKGTDVLAEALPIVWREEPDFTMVWAGEGRRWTAKGQEAFPNMFKEYSRSWGSHTSQVIYLGVIEKSHLYAVLKKAEATVIPSRRDNLPNTAIESLSLGVPVIGTRGASIDELVEPGYSGEVVEIDDPKALAEVMIKVWRKTVPWLSSGFRRPAVLDEMVPAVAASNLLRLAGF